MICSFPADPSSLYLDSSSSLHHFLSMVPSSLQLWPFAFASTRRRPTNGCAFINLIGLLKGHSTSWITLTVQSAGDSVTSQHLHSCSRHPGKLSEDQGTLNFINKLAVTLWLHSKGNGAATKSTTRKRMRLIFMVEAGLRIFVVFWI